MRGLAARRMVLSLQLEGSEWIAVENCDISIGFSNVAVVVTRQIVDWLNCVNCNKNISNNTESVTTINSTFFITERTPTIFFNHNIPSSSV